MERHTHLLLFVYRLFKIRSKIDSYLLNIPRKIIYEAVCPCLAVRWRTQYCLGMYSFSFLFIESYYRIGANK